MSFENDKKIIEFQTDDNIKKIKWANNGNCIACLTQNKEIKIFDINKGDLATLT